MAEPNEIANGDKPVAPESKTEAKAELPVVESPPLSPAEKLSEPVLDAQMKPQAAPEVKPEPVAAAAAKAKPRFAIPQIKMPAMKIPDMKIAAPKMSRRNRRRAALAATIMLAAGFGAAAGAIATRQPASPPAKPNTALLEENHALQRSVAKLNKDLTTLRANVESAARESKTQIAKATASLSDRLDKAMDVTGSIGKPAATAAATPPAIAAPAPLPPPRPSIVQGWTVREARNGRVWVENRGELYAVAPGVPLPGLGRVEAIRRDGDSLIVATTKGLITENQTTAAVRPRPQPRYYTPYWEPY